MKLLRHIAEVRAELAPDRRAGRRVGFVPTMGALHEGHGSLIDACRRECDRCVVSIFVNPLQFGPSEDFERYPRDLEADLAFCRARGVDVVFAPSVEEMYPEPPLTFVVVEQLSEPLCGRSRPGHFRGVATVCAKLFHIVQPDVAYFGQKDAQQATILRRMVEDLNFPLQIRVLPTVREPDGLALSSRNRYLSAGEREAAGCLFLALSEAAELARKGERDAAVLVAAMAREIGATQGVRLDYAAVVDEATFEEVREVRGPARALVAAWVGSTRLIDNLPLPEPSAR